MPFTLERSYVVTNQMNGNSEQGTLGWNAVLAERNVNKFCLPPAPFWLLASTYFSNADRNACSSATSVDFCQTSWCHMSEGRNHHFHRFKHVKSCKRLEILLYFKFMNIIYHWCIGIYAPTTWPPRSPVFNPLNFCVWGYLKALAYSQGRDNSRVMWTSPRLSTNASGLRNGFDSTWEDMPMHIWNQKEKSLSTCCKCIYLGKEGFADTNMDALILFCYMQLVSKVCPHSTLTRYTVT